MSIIRTITTLLIALLATASNINSQTSVNPRGYIVSVGDPMPEFELTDINGRQYNRESLLGQIYVLQFTASWCAVCRQEMPHLQREVWNRFKAANFVLLGVDYDEPKEKVESFAKQMGITYPIAPDPEGAVFYTIAAPKSGVTRNVVVDSKGTIIFLTRLFEQTEFTQMIETISNALE